MTVKECYTLLSADFDGVMSRLLAEKRVAKFAARFPDDPSFNQLLSSLEGGDIATAFRAAHTLKGTSANLGFTSLYEKASAVTEELRNGNPGPDFGKKLEECKKEYAGTLEILNRYISEKED